MVKVAANLSALTGCFLLPAIGILRTFFRTKYRHSPNILSAFSEHFWDCRSPICRLQKPEICHQTDLLQIYLQIYSVKQRRGVRAAARLLLKKFDEDERLTDPWKDHSAEG